MPEYFFHIGLELLPQAEHTPSLQTSAPIDLTYAFNALRPFSHPSTRRTPVKPLSQKERLARSHNSTDIANANLTTTTAWESERACSSHDHRADKIEIECVDMESLVAGESKNESSQSHIEKGIGHAVTGAQTKGRYEAVLESSSGEEWGIVHLYRDAVETPGLYRDSQYKTSNSWTAGSGAVKPAQAIHYPPAKDEECTTLCILAVPSYLTPSDFLAFVGENTRNNVSHFRMIRTARANRYMVLMKFKHGRVAREWQHEWNGKVFNSMEASLSPDDHGQATNIQQPETCHVVFLKSVEITQPQNPSATAMSKSDNDGTSTYPRMSNDPFGAATTSAKPLAPRTPALVELPTCPVCLERMDETAGLLTILCQHVFHCTCLQKWSGGGCPVCRYTHDDFSSKSGTTKYKSKLHNSEYDLLDEPLRCEHEGCQADDSLWQCLICGKVGCGRYAGKHAYKHYEESGHTFSMDLVNKRVWDYAADVYVHRIIQDAAKPGEKLVELPGSRRAVTTTALEADDDVEVTKMENVALEYTHLLTSQLESQRVYFEEIVERAVDKASQAVKTAERASNDCEKIQYRHDTLAAEHEALAAEHQDLLNRVLPDLQNNKTKLEKRSSKFEEMAKNVNTKYLEEKSLASSLMERIKHIEETQVVALQNKIKAYEEEMATNALLMEGLREEHRDAMFQLSAQKKLQDMVQRGEIDQQDLDGATISTGPARKRNPHRGTTAGSVEAKEPFQDWYLEEFQYFAESIFNDQHRYKLGPKWNMKHAIGVMREVRKGATLKGLTLNQLRDLTLTSMVDKRILLRLEPVATPLKELQKKGVSNLEADVVLSYAGIDPDQFQVGPNWNLAKAAQIVEESKVNSEGKSVETILKEYRQKLLDEQFVIRKDGTNEPGGSATDPAHVHSRTESTASTVITGDNNLDQNSLLPVFMVLDFDPAVYETGPNWTPDIAKEVGEIQASHEERVKPLHDNLLIKGLVLRANQPGWNVLRAELDSCPCGCDSEHTLSASEAPEVPVATTSKSKKNKKGKKSGRK